VTSSSKNSFCGSRAIKFIGFPRLSLRDLDFRHDDLENLTNSSPDRCLPVFKIWWILLLNCNL